MSLSLSENLLPIIAITLLSLIVTHFCIMRIPQLFLSSPSEKKPDHQVTKPTSLIPELAVIIKNLLSELPSRIILPDDTDAFRQLMNVYWAKQECEVLPACIIQPQTVQQLSTIVKILKRAFDDLNHGINGAKEKRTGIFAVRGGGHSPVSGAASIEGGIIIDLSLFREVTPSEDRKSVVIGAGCKWGDVSKVLDQKGLAVVGGRNSAVGVGGLTLGGGISFFTPRFGLVCSNVISYEVLLASGSLIKASESTHPDLWRALKGGGNNFGIVTSFTVKCFPCADIWSGFLYLPSFQTSKVLAAFHQTIENYSSHSKSENTAGPIVCFSYVHSLGIQAISVNLVDTSPPPNPRKWPTYWKNSPFNSLWRLWSTCKTQSLSSATDELNALNPPGRRQIFVTTTIKNDATTLTGVHAAYSNAIPALRHRNVKGLAWTLFIQPLLPAWVRKGDPNPLGLDEEQDSLVLVSFTINWDERKDDEFMRDMARSTLNEIDAFARANGTAHRYRYFNYCTGWQRPFEGYGEENKRFLEEVRKKYDVDGLFQRGCTGGFKLSFHGEDGEA
ncbi:hypothetical protein HYFRA_00013195 [Hymenoscyphus fraxineus]|uniref:FAD-binding PCMH-type domain-containing protein n=1 Tax=Hymenoscyphus fraxineus TaxID=746836 RepID=A0A9N9PZR9_9HELO|nr:hypothetical protein HYFRA_00013195 [Hymenoscyphus fraxineus]